MSRDLLNCAVCGTRLPAALMNAPTPQRCPQCRTEMIVGVFPAVRTDTLPETWGEPLAAADASPCFYHAEKQAVVPCDQCGRFLCSLCQVQLLGSNLCCNCIDQGIRRGYFQELKTTYQRNDVQALAAAFFPLLGLPLLGLEFIFRQDFFAYLAAFLIFPGIILLPVALLWAIKNRRVQTAAGRIRSWRSWAVAGIFIVYLGTLAALVVMLEDTQNAFS